MSRGLLAPLSPQEEIVLRRIAHGSTVVDAQAMSRLMSLALVECVNASLRLTPLGRLRFNALPKAPLLARPRSVQVASDYVAGVIEKAQSMATGKSAPLATARLDRKMAPPRAAGAHDDARDGGTPSEDEDALSLPVDLFSDMPHWRSRAERNIAKLRQGIVEDRRRHEKLREESRRCIDVSRSLLRQTVPVTPAWMIALQ